MQTYKELNITHYHVSQRLFINKVLHRHVCIVFLPNPPRAISNLPYCSSHGWVTFLKHCYWLVGQKYNTHVTVKDQIYE
jgi:hypothetical protein